MMGTLVHELAMLVVYESALQVLATVCTAIT